MIARALASPRHPVLAHIVPMRRCNLSCAYCNEYDSHSQPVPLGVMYGRVDRLAELGTSVIVISGGEPLLYPHLDALIARIRKRGAMAGMITNGYLLTRDRVLQLNRAGLDHLQISIDNLMPDEVSKKSLKVLDRKLQVLAQHAELHVNINSVVGAGFRNPHDALEVARRAREFGFTSSVGIIHDGSGQLRSLAGSERQVYRKLRTMDKGSYTRFQRFQDNIAEGKENEWRCRAGARYLYVCEDGLVHYCSQQRGAPGKPLADYTGQDLRREFTTAKSCSPRCTVACVHRVSLIDAWRAPQVSPPRQKLDLIQIETTSRKQNSCKEMCALIPSHSPKVSTELFPRPPQRRDEQ